MPERMSCVVVTVGRPEPAAEIGLRACEDAGVPVWRVAVDEVPDATRSRAASDALRLGYDAIVWAGPRAAADPVTVERLLARTGAVVCDRSGLTLTRRVAFDAVRAACHLPECRGPDGAAFVPYFQSSVRCNGGGPAEYLPADAAFVARAREAGVEVAADPVPDHDDLPAASPDVRRRVLVLCSLPRAGAGLLARLMRESGIGLPQSYFHPAIAGPLAARWGVAVGDRSGYAAAVVRHRTTANGVTAVIAEWWPFAHAWPQASSRFGPETRYLYVTRRDVTAQAVSLHLAHTTGMWGRDGVQATPGEPPGRLADLTGVREAAEQIRQDDQDWRGHFVAAGVEPLPMQYEQLVTDPVGAVRRVAAWVGLADGEYRVPRPEPRDVRRPAAVEAARADLLARFRASSPPAPAGGRSALRGPAAPLPDGFPRIRAYVLGDPAAVEGLVAADLPTTAVPPPAGGPAGGADHYRAALEQAAAAACDFAVILGDGVRVGRHLAANLAAVPVVRRDQCDYLGLYVPAPGAVVWERHEPHLGYRLARTGDRAWGRPWAARTVVLSRRFVRAALDRWAALAGDPADRVAAVGSDARARAWYPVRPLAEDPRAASPGPGLSPPGVFDPAFRLEVGPGFQPPEEVPGWLKRSEGELLWATAVGRRVLELGTASGRATVCLAQSAQSVVTVGRRDPAEAAEWVRRYGVADRVEFRRGEVQAVAPALPFGFEFVLVDTEHDAATVAGDLAAAGPRLAPAARIAFHDYGSPRWPAVARVADDHARRLKWEPVGRAGHLAVFQT